MAQAVRKDFGHPFFSEVVFTATWNIWIQWKGRLSSLLPGIFGYNGMGRSSEMKNPHFKLGEETLFMTSLFCLTGLDVDIKIGFCLG